jgi:hypothetical protein
MARADGQLINRRVYDNKNLLIREGLVPLSIKNERAALMAYWEVEDARQAEAEATEAEKRAAELSAPQEPGAAELVEPLAERLASAEAELGILRNLKQATPDAVLEGVHQIARAAGAAALVEAAAQTAIATVDAAAAGARALLAKIEGTVNQTAAAVGQLLADGRQSLERTQAEMVAKTNNAILKRIAKFELDVAKLRGPTGSRGRIGQGLIAGAGKRPEKRPDGSEWALGDSYLNVKPEGYQLEYLTADGWSKPVRMVPEPKLINASVTHVDQAPKATVLLGASGSGGTSGGGSDRLTTRTISNGTPTTVADSSNWSAGGTTIQACVLHMRISTGTGSAFLSAAINIDPAGTVEITEYSLLGSLTSTTGFSVDLTARLGTPVIPAGVTPPAAGGQPAMFVTATARGLTGTVAFVEGVVIWLPRAQGSTSTLSGVSPVWVIT